MFIAVFGRDAQKPNTIVSDVRSVCFHEPDDENDEGGTLDLTFYGDDSDIELEFKHDVYVFAYDEDHNFLHQVVRGDSHGPDVDAAASADTAVGPKTFVHPGTKYVNMLDRGRLATVSTGEVLNGGDPFTKRMLCLDPKSVDTLIRHLSDSLSGIGGLSRVPASEEPAGETTETAPWNAESGSIGTGARVEVSYGPYSPAHPGTIVECDVNKLLGRAIYTVMLDSGGDYTVRCGRHRLNVLRPVDEEPYPDGTKVLFLKDFCTWRVDDSAVDRNGDDLWYRISRLRRDWHQWAGADGRVHSFVASRHLLELGPERPEQGDPKFRLSECVFDRATSRIGNVVDAFAPADMGVYGYTIRFDERTVFRSESDLGPSQEADEVSESWSENMAFRPGDLVRGHYGPRPFRVVERRAKREHGVWQEYVRVRSLDGASTLTLTNRGAYHIPQPHDMVEVGQHVHPDAPFQTLGRVLSSPTPPGDGNQAIRIRTVEGTCVNVSEHFMRVVWKSRDRRSAS